MKNQYNCSHLEIENNKGSLNHGFSSLFNHVHYRIKKYNE